LQNVFSPTEMITSERYLHLWEETEVTWTRIWENMMGCQELPTTTIPGVLWYWQPYGLHIVMQHDQWMHVKIQLLLLQCWLQMLFQKTYT